MNAKSAVRYTGIVFAVLAALVLLLLAGVYFTMRASLPQLSGETKLASLKNPVTVARDERGTVVITSPDFVDAMRALGYVHAQERFFEMDLTRRSAAGELSELFGRATLKMDQEKRTHRLRARLTANLVTAGADDRKLITAYTEGVNAGLAALPAKPWPYLLLQTTPQPWRDVDSLLVVSEMYSTLQLSGTNRAFGNAALREVVGDKLFGWLRPPGGKWDAALDGSQMEPAPLPTEAQIDTRKTKAASNAAAAINVAETDPEFAIGSNNWAVTGALTQHGGAMLADDMHLNLGVPNIWFRAEFHLQTPAGQKRIAGVTLPGGPAFVIGSNGDIAWGFTNTEGRWYDWVKVPAGEPVTEQHEEIKLAGETSVPLTVRETRWGPIVHTWRKQDYALHWIAYQPGAINAELSDLALAHSVDEALPIAQQSGVPHQNILIVDKAGNAAWTVAGRMQARTAQEKTEWAGFASPQGLPRPWLPPAAYPLVKNPADGRLWTANNRQMGGDAGAKIAEGGFDLGARAQQIRDRLREKQQFDEAALYAIQLDREARFVRHWAELLKTVSSKSDNADLRELNRILSTWNGQADPDQAGYRAAREFRAHVYDELWAAWMRAAAPDLGFPVRWDARIEYPAWQALSAQAPHLLPPKYASWDAFLLAQAERVVKDMKEAGGGSIAKATWGQRNTARISHPFSLAVPLLGRVLDMPATPLPGDNHMPMVLTVNQGASERMVVAPGHEETGILVMPGGQSGHPLSPFYGAGHQDWLQGRPAPLLAGEARYTLRLIP